MRCDPALERRQNTGNQRNAVMSRGPVDPIEPVLSAPAKWTDNWCWLSLNILMPRYFDGRKCPSTFALWSTQTSTRGGASETDVNELAVMPCGLPSRVAHRNDGDAGWKLGARAAELGFADACRKRAGALA